MPATPDDVVTHAAVNVVGTVGVAKDTSMRAMPHLTPVRTSPPVETTTVESAACEADAEVSGAGVSGESGHQRISSAPSTSRDSSLKTPSRRLPVWEYVQSELGLSNGALGTHDPDMAVARERVFDIIWYIPVEFERLNLYGGALCADAVLGAVTSLPIRVVCQTVRLVSGPWERLVGRGKRLTSRSQSSKIPNTHAREFLSDSLWLFILLGASVTAGKVDVSVLYHYIRGQEVIKLYLACSVLECFDKLCSAFNCHVLDALSHSASLAVGSSGSATQGFKLGTWVQLLFDLALATATTTAHTLILLTHAVTLSVAINSHTNAMLLVLISNNFGEIKGHVFKKMDDAKVFTAARMDIVERVHLSVELLFVAAQRVTASGSLALGLDSKLLKDSAMVLFSEVFVDVFKHAFISKFNGLRPRVYRGFFRQLCREHVKLPQSYKLHRVVGFVPLAPAAVLLKALPGLYKTLVSGRSNSGSYSLEFVTSSFSWLLNRGLLYASFLVNKLGFDVFLDVTNGISGVDSSGLEGDEMGSVGSLVAPKSVWFGASQTLWQTSLPPTVLTDVAWFVLAFTLLTVFKLAFGVALHWFGARMLDTLPKDVGEGKRGSRNGSKQNSPHVFKNFDEKEPPNPWRNPGTRVLFEKKKEDKGVKEKESRRSETGSTGDDTHPESLTKDDKTVETTDTITVEKTNQPVEVRRVQSSGSVVRGALFSDLIDEKTPHSSKPPVHTQHPTAPESPKRESIDLNFTPGSPHYKLYPDYPGG